MGYSTVVLVSTPFLIPGVIDDYNVSLGTASLVSVCQLGGFVVGSFFAGRGLQPKASILRISLVLSVVANLVSAAVPTWPLLLGARSVSGLALGLIAWFGWSQAFGSSAKSADIAVVGPLIGVVAAPALAIAVEMGGLRALFLMLAGLAVVPLFWIRESDVSAVARSKTARRSKAVPAARVLLGALFLFTLGGSGVFQFVIVVGAAELGLTTATMSIAFSLNALAGIPAARWPLDRRGIPGPWMVATACMALTVGMAWSPWLFGAAIVIWGFTFWMAIPGVFAVLAAKSAYPEQRAGDAQAIMAAGRVVGPLLGGLVLEAFGNEVFGVLGFVTMASAGLAVTLIRLFAEPRADLE